MRVIDGPHKGREFRSRLPVIDLPYPNSLFKDPETIESYERIGDYWFHKQSRRYPRPSTTNPANSENHEVLKS